jgi:hypothetical protein
LGGGVLPLISDFVCQEEVCLRRMQRMQKMNSKEKEASKKNNDDVNYRLYEYEDINRYSTVSLAK